MSAYDTELATLKARLATDTGERLETAKRRIRDVEAAIAAEPAPEPRVPETTEMDHGDIETAMLPKPKRSTRK